MCNSKDQKSWAIFLPLSENHSQVEKQGPNFLGHIYSLVSKSNQVQKKGPNFMGHFSTFVLKTSSLILGSFAKVSLDSFKSNYKCLSFALAMSKLGSGWFKSEYTYLGFASAACNSSYFSIGAIDG